MQISRIRLSDKTSRVLRGPLRGYLRMTDNDWRSTLQSKIIAPSGFKRRQRGGRDGVAPFLHEMGDCFRSIT
jgi:hypothetical protein